jgi:hypothetical protein
MVHRLRSFLCAWLQRCCGSAPTGPGPGGGAGVGIADLAPPASRTRRPLRPSVVLYLPDVAESTDTSDAAVARALEALPGWPELAKTYGGTEQLRPRRAFTDSPALDQLIARANANAERAGVRGYRPLDHRRYFVLPIPAQTGKPPFDAYCELKSGLQRIGGRVYLSQPTRGAAASAAYAGAASAGAAQLGGIGATGLVSRHSGRAIDGEGHSLIDVEKAWITFSNRMQNLSAPHAAVESGELADLRHGTAVSAIVLGFGAASPGLAPAARFYKAPCVAPSGSLDPEGIVAAAILAAGVQLSQPPMGTGVLLIQQETWDGLPLESSPLEFAAIQTVAAAGHLVVQPAGNGERDLDATSGFWIDAANNLVERPLNPQQSPATSGAITVAAACSGLDPALGGFGQPHPQTNRGALVDCWAWGDSIATLGATIDANGAPVAVPEVAGFGGTSGAAAIVGAAVLLLQHLRSEAGSPAPLMQPAQLRTWLRNTELGTPGAGAFKGLAMPDLARLKQHLDL